MVDAVTNRIARELENREATVRKQEWKPPQLLPDPNPVEGWRFRWVRIALMGQNDPTNTSAKFREGWEPCAAADHPEIAGLADPNGRFKGNIEIGGLLLCKMPVEIDDQRRQYYKKQADAQMEAVDSNYMRQQDPRMPLFAERRSTTSFGKGSK